MPPKKPLTRSAARKVQAEVSSSSDSDGELSASPKRIPKKQPAKTSKQTPYKPGPLSRKVVQESSSSGSESPVKEVAKKTSEKSSKDKPNAKVVSKQSTKRQAPLTSSSSSDKESEKKQSSSKSKRSRKSGAVFVNHVRQRSSEPPATTSSITASTSTYTIRDISARIKEFSSKTEVTEWTDIFRRATRHLSEVDKLDMFHSKITPNYFAWFSTLEKDGIEKTCEDWLQNLEQKFKRNPTELRDLVTSRKQLEGENPEDFIAEIRERCHRYNPLMLESEIVAFIRDNVNEKYAKKFVSLNIHSTTLSMTLQSLRAAMDKAMLASKSVSESTPKTVFFSGRENHQSVDQTVCQYCKKIGHTADRCFAIDNLRRNQDRQADRQSDRNESSRGRQDQRTAGKRVTFGSPKDQTGRCYNCNRKGHIARNCEARRQGGSNYRSGNRFENRREMSRSPTPSNSGNGK